MLKKIIISFIGIITAVCGILIVSLPSIISTNWGSEISLNYLNSGLPGNVMVKSVDLNWSGPQRIEGFTLYDPNGEIVLSFDHFSTDTPLYKFLFKNFDIKKLKISNLNTQIKPMSNGQINLNASINHELLTFDPGKLKVLEATNVEIDLDRSGYNFTLKGIGKTKIDGSDGSFEFDIAKNGGKLQCFSAINQIPTKLLEAIFAINNPEIAGYISLVFGKIVNITADQTSDNNGQSIIISANSPILNLNLDLSITDEYIVLQNPTEIYWQLSDDLVDLLLDEEQKIIFSNSKKISIEVKKLKIPLQIFSQGISKDDIKNLVFESSVTLPDFALEDASKLQFNEFVIRFGSGDRSKHFGVHMDGSFLVENQASKFLLNALIDKPAHINNLTKSIFNPAEIQLSLENISSKFIDKNLGLNNQLTKLLGTNFTLRILTRAKDPKTVSLMLNSEKIEIPNLKLTIDQDIFFGSLPLRSALSGEIKADSIIMKKQVPVNEIRSLNLSWKGISDFSEFGFVISADTLIEKKGEKGNVSGSVFLRDIFTFDKQTIKVNLRGESIATTLMGGLTSFGNSLDFNIDSEINNGNGHLIADIKGDAGYLYLNSHIKNSYLYLDEPVIGEIKITSYLTNEILNSYIPIIDKLVIQDGDKITFKVSDENFSLPLYPFKIDDFDFNSIKVDLGTLIFKNEGEVYKLMSKLKTVRSEQISIITTPLYLTMNQGALKVWRTDMLLMKRYPVAIWGKIDFVKDRVNLILGLTAQSLSKAFEIESLNHNFMLQLPIEGSVKNAKMDTTKAFTRLAAIIAQHNGGLEGIVIGKVLDIANGKQGKVPPPTTSPLPWENIEISEQEKPKKEKFNPAKEIKKEASKLFKNLLK